MKDQLANLIEAYAAARGSNNRMLIEYAIVQLNQFVSKVDVSEVTEDE